MRALLCREWGEVKDLRIEDVPVRTASGVRAAAVAYAGLAFRSAYRCVEIPGQAAAPLRAGTDVAAR